MTAVLVSIAFVVGLVAGWLITAAHAAKELRRKHAEWEERAAWLKRARLVAVQSDPNMPRGVAYMFTGGGKTGGDAA